MAQNEYRADAEKKKRGVYGVSDTTSILANQAAMNKQIEALTKEFQGFTLANKQQQVAAVIVLKLGSVIDSEGVLGHWVIGRTTKSQVEPHERIG